ncbi:Brefeldin A-inhibited guanine nucleotide-exchange protein 3 [Eumeta japonica]|uniref:Brefeldin A-inhibited guanine nucleotide-exchange protein 3 n=1 Tax=Eumeta variegata TaxID=151549 RepID=A0A4C1TCG8_EUMVA|nr:Brefeldin A-inhibited guanine nucleotide-exchange protein 3 [Eumeta japonica]
MRHPHLTTSSPNGNRDMETGEKLQTNNAQNEKLNMAPISIDDDETCASDTTKVLCGLSHQAENFSDAAERLSLPSLCQFLKNLCNSESSYTKVLRHGKAVVWWPKGWPLLVDQSELPYFHFNEALLKPFENLLSMDSCDSDVQDQIVACLYEIVEAHRTEIRSGWRPLFGTLRNARSRMLNASNIIDIFRVFLDSDNTLVFANAGLDCILCLLSFLEVPGAGVASSGSASSSSNINDEENNYRPTEFLHETLRFLERCSSILELGLSSHGSMTVLQLSKESCTKVSNSATLALKQLLLVLIECAVQVQETVARVGVSCLKHVILSTGTLFNEYQWMIACSAIHRACTVTIAPLRQLSFAFHEKSNSFYGDCANVKVAARRDSSVEELSRIYALAQQVFLSDNQREPGTKLNNHLEKHLTDDRSYSFLLYPQNNGFSSNLDNFVIRIPFKTLVVGLLANQMLLQLVAKLLLSRLKCVPQAVSTCIFDNYTTATQQCYDYDLDFRSKEILLRCCLQFLTSALEFDSRPGLKFLMQKVANIEYAANLYKQMTSSWMVYYIALVDSYLNDIVIYNLGTEDLNFILESCSRLNTTKVKKKENFVRYLFCLQDAWNLVCELYLNNSVLHDIESGRLRAADNSDLKHLNCAAKNIKAVCITLNGNIENVSTSGLADNNDYSPQKSQHIPEEESITMTTLISEFQPKSRNNPFDTNRPQKPETETISPEIEQQRATSILKDSNYKRSALAQLVVASLELLRSLPSEAEGNLKLLMTPTIREAFRLVQPKATN